MKLHILSDLHLEHAPFTPPNTDADVVILAGDIDVGSRGVFWASEQFDKPVIYVPGNHEYWDFPRSMEETNESMQVVAERAGIHLLDNCVWDSGEVRFIGTTLWTDLQREPVNGKAIKILEVDQSKILMAKGGLLSTEIVQSIYENNLEWLQAQLETPYSGKTVVITHHAPSMKSQHQQYASSEMAAAFISDLEHLMGENVDLWIHGHTHNNFDYEVKGTRVVCNPRGYPHPFGGWDNAEFRSDLLVEIAD
ncbi:phosphoesterase [Mariprofundus sp. NF]|uniref:metallophosphoesterase n=1 Tax=Mariprofundus sp. NF TaxID=2608716 RepID=UPI0015A40DD2|nr:metallophosphoesterase [Mariprofundus sp. NF]NWF38280.1 phosphoesterase [Mariprofundus sp. NF]